MRSDDLNKVVSASIRQTPSLEAAWTDDFLSAQLKNQAGADLRTFDFTDETDVPSTLKCFGQSEEYLTALIGTATANLSLFVPALSELKEQRRIFDEGRVQLSAGRSGNTLGLSNLSIGGSSNPPTSHVSFSNKTNDDISVLSGGTIHTSQGKGSSLKTEVPLDAVEEGEGEESTDVETEAASDESNKVGTDESKSNSNSEDTECAQSQFGVVEVEDASASQM
jgi:hypothetical protein